MAFRAFIFSVFSPFLLFIILFFVFTCSPQAWVSIRTFFLLRTFFLCTSNAKAPRKNAFFFTDQPVAKSRHADNCLFKGFDFGIVPFLFSFLSFVLYFLDRSPLTGQRSSVMPLSVFGYRSPKRPILDRSPIINRSAILPIPIPTVTRVRTCCKPRSRLRTCTPETVHNRSTQRDYPTTCPCRRALCGIRDRKRPEVFPTTRPTQTSHRSGFGVKAFVYLRQAEEFCRSQPSLSPLCF